MKTIQPKKALFIAIVASLAVVAVPTFADLPAECLNLPHNVGAPSAELISLCASDVSPLGGMGGETEVFGWESVSDALNSFGLSTPDVLNVVGGTDFGNFVGACDFAGSDLSVIYCLDGPGNLWTTDTTTGTTNTIGMVVPFGAETFSSLDWDPSTGTMYAASTSITAGSIYTIDLDAPSAFRIGATSNVCPIAGGFDNAGNYYMMDICDDSLHSVDKNTGSSSVIGAFGFNANFGQGMDFDATTDTCYYFAFNADTFQGEHRECDPSDGSSTLIGAIGATTPGGLNQIGGGGVAAANEPVTPIVEIPTIGQFGALALILLLSGSAFVVLRRRAHQ